MFEAFYVTSVFKNFFGCCLFFLVEKEMEAMMFRKDKI